MIRNGAGWAGKRVLVTGAGGFIGSHLAERLAELGAETRALVHYRGDGRWGWLDDSPYRQHMQVVMGDITDRESMRGAMHGVDVVFHLAALIAIPYSYHAPSSYVRTNVEGTLNVLQLAREENVARVVHTSTSEVYGTARHVPIAESHPLQGQSPYSASKIGADKIAEAYHLSFDLPVVTVRPFNTYGPRQSARAVIPAIIAQALAGGPVRLGSLHPTRDLTYVSDTVAGFIAAGEAPAAPGMTYNLGTGTEISIGDLAARVCALTGGDLDIIGDDDARVRPERSEVERLLSDNSSARDALGWTPRVSLDDGLTATIEWMRPRVEQYRPGTYVV